MSPAVGAIAVAAALALIAVVLNQVQARLALVEVALNEGLPPGFDASTVDGYEPSVAGTVGETPELAAPEALGHGVHIFLSRTCHACQRLLDDLAARRVDLDPLTIRYVDRPRPLATEVAEFQSAALVADAHELSDAVRADPLPYTIAVGPHGLVARSVTPTRRHIVDLARQAGLETRS